MVYYSHIKKENGVIKEEESTLLPTHLLEVAERTQKYFFFDHDESLSQVAYFIGLTHDFGKYTTYFQDHLRGERHWGALSNHAFLSALYTALVLQTNSIRFSIDTKIKPILPLLGFFVVFHHHSDLRSLEYTIICLEDESHQAILAKQIADLTENASKINQELPSLGLLPIETLTTQLVKIKQDLTRQNYQFKNKLDQEEKAQAVILVLSFFLHSLMLIKRKQGRFPI